MKKIVYILLLFLLSCSTKKIQQEWFVTGEDIKKESRRYANDFAGLLAFYNEMGTNQFQADSTEVVLEVFSQKFGLRNKNTSEILRTEYTYLAFLNTDYLLAENGSFYGVIDPNGKIVLPIEYEEINFYNVEKPFFIVGKNNKKAIINGNGNLIHPFTINYFNSSVIYENKVFLVTDEENYKQQLLKIIDGKIEIIPDVYNFQKINSRVAAFHHDKRGSRFDGLYNMENDSVLDGFGKLYYHKSKNEIWATTQKSKYKLYDTVIDSSFIVNPNPLANIERIVNGYIYQKTENGYKLMDLNDKILPFIYPKVEPFDTTVRDDIHGKEWGNFRKHLFKFYINIDDSKYGIIDNTGKIIVPANKYDIINLADMYDTYSYYNNIGHEKKQYLQRKKLDRIFYVSEKTNTSKNILLDINGDEILTIDKGYYADLEQFSFHNHLIATKRDTVKIYDLNTKKVAYTANGYGLDFKELYPSGYRYWKSTEEGNMTEVTYLSNKLNVLYQTKVKSDSLYFKLPTKGDKIFFTKNNLKGLLNFNEEEIVPAEYSEITIPTPDYNIVKQNGKFGVITNNNSRVINIIYDKIEFQINTQSFNCFLNNQMKRIYVNELMRK